MEGLVVKTLFDVKYELINKSKYMGPLCFLEIAFFTLEASSSYQTFGNLLCNYTLPIPIEKHQITLSLMASSRKCFHEVSKVITRGGHS